MRPKTKKITHVHRGGKGGKRVKVEGYVEWTEGGAIYRSPEYVYNYRYPKEEEEEE